MAGIFLFHRGDETLEPGKANQRRLSPLERIRHGIGIREAFLQKRVHHHPIHHRMARDVPVFRFIAIKAVIAGKIACA
jgi:hypothetical protein